MLSQSTVPVPDTKVYLFFCSTALLFPAISFGTNPWERFHPVPSPEPWITPFMHWGLYFQSCFQLLPSLPCWELRNSPPPLPSELDPLFLSPLFRCFFPAHSCPEKKPRQASNTSYRCQEKRGVSFQQKRENHQIFQLPKARVLVFKTQPAHQEIKRLHFHFAVAIRKVKVLTTEFLSHAHFFVLLPQPTKYTKEPAQK